MNTTELKNGLHKKLEGLFSPALTKEEVSLIVDKTVELFSEGLLSQDEEGENKVVLRGFGTLKQVERKGRTYSVRGQQVTVGPRKTVVFKPGTDLARSLTEQD